MKSSAAHAAAAAQSQQIGLEMQQDQVRRQFAETDANRKSLEVLRNSQRARAMSLNSATNQGASQGSGLQGGYGQIAGMSNTNALGIGQGLEQGRQMFDLNAQISKTKIAQGDAASQSATGSGLSSLGSSLMGTMGASKQLFGGSGSSSSSPGIFSPFSLNAG